jgi:hypothetical protein
MKAIVAGGRHGKFSINDALRLAYLLGTYHVDEVVHGDYGHVDKGAGRVGHALALKVTPFPADWDTYGKSAGPRRNGAMARYVGAEGILISFPGGRGTVDMIAQATAMGLRHIEAWDVSR